MAKPHAPHPWTRRAFTTAVAASPALARASAPPVRIAFLGATHSHAADKLRLVRASSDFELATIWEPDPKLAAQLKRQGIRLADSAEQILDDDSVAAVAVEGPVRDHGRHGLLAVQAGKHVHVEKPPALDVESFRAIQDTAARQGLVVQTGYMWRHHPALKRIFEAVRAGWLGEVHLVQAVIHKTLGAERRPTWGEFRGGQMFELGGHVIDPMVRLLGRPNRVTPFLRKDGDFDDSFADNTAAVFEFPNAMGLVIGSSVSRVGSRYRSFEVHGSNGIAVIRPMEPARLTVELAETAGAYAKGKTQVVLDEFDRYAEDMREFAAAIRGEADLSITPREDLIVQEALIAASGM